MYLSEKIWKSNLMSIPDMFRKTYGSRTGIVSAFLIFILSSPAPYILSLGILIKFIFNLDLVWGLIIATGFSIAYVWNGGLSAIVKTDYFQILLMYLGLYSIGRLFMV